MGCWCDKNGAFKLIGGDVMSMDCINQNPAYLKTWIEREKTMDAEYYKQHPDSVILLFQNELRELGFEFEICGQMIGFMPKHKDVILPLVIKYYQQAKQLGKDNEQNSFLTFFKFKGLEVVVPMLLEDYYSNETKDLTRWFISDCFYSIRSKKYISDYLKIISNEEYGDNRQLIILLLGEMKVEEAIPVFIKLLEDESVRLHAICALGCFKRKEFLPYFERFSESKHPGWRKYAKLAIKKTLKQN